MQIKLVEATLAIQIIFFLLSSLLLWGKYIHFCDKISMFTFESEN